MRAMVAVQLVRRDARGEAGGRAGGGITRGKLFEQRGDLIHFLSFLLAAPGRKAARSRRTHVFLVDEKGRKKVFISVFLA